MEIFGKFNLSRKKRFFHFFYFSRNFIRKEIQLFRRLYVSKRSEKLLNQSSIVIIHLFKEMGLPSFRSFYLE